MICFFKDKKNFSFEQISNLYCFSKPHWDYQITIKGKYLVNSCSLNQLELFEKFVVKVVYLDEGAVPTTFVELEYSI